MKLNIFEQFETSFYKFEQVLTSLNKFWQVLTILDKFWQIWTSLDKCLRLWVQIYDSPCCCWWWWWTGTTSSGCIFSALLIAVCWAAFTLFGLLLRVVLGASLVLGFVDSGKDQKKKFPSCFNWYVYSPYKSTGSSVHLFNI